MTATLTPNTAGQRVEEARSAIPLRHSASALPRTRGAPPGADEVLVWDEDHASAGARSAFCLASAFAESGSDRCAIAFHATRRRRSRCSYSSKAIASMRPTVRIHDVTFALVVLPGRTFRPHG